MNTPLSETLRSWYTTRVRPIFQKTDHPQLIQDFDKQADNLVEQEKKKQELMPICLLGQAGVGKSTLINTLVAGTGVVVPSGGGTGPLTANALRVCHGDRPSFIVNYHGKQVINQTRFILDAKLRRESKAAEIVAAPPEPLPEVSLEGFENGSDEDKKTRTEEALRRAKLLVAGSQTEDRPLPYLIDALSVIQGLPVKHGSTISADDLRRLGEAKIAAELGSNKTPRHYDSEIGNKEFRSHLRDHACGFLSPLIAEMTIRWNSPMLHDGVELVDLPGIGIHNDIYETVAADYLRTRAKAVLLVADSRGLRKEDAETLRDSGFLNRFLHASDNPESDPVSLMVAVVKVDDVALENWRNDKEQNGAALKTKAEHFAVVVESCRRDVASQLRAFLSEVWRSQDGELQKDKDAIIRRLCDSLEVFPLSALQYRKLLEEDPDDRAFLPSPEHTFIPALREAITRVALACSTERETRFDETSRRFFAQLCTRLTIARESLSVEARAEHERTRLESALADFLNPKRREFDTRRGEFRGFLRQTIPGRIQDKVDTAAATAKNEIGAYLESLRYAHWATLRASVRREGTFHGSRIINLPHDFSLRFEEPIAQVWSTGILKDVRKQTGAFADYQADAVSSVLDWSKENGVKVTPKLLEALVEDVQQNRKQLNAVGKDAIEELRQHVKQQLIREIENPIRKKCQDFVRRGDDIGPGVRDRILSLFRDLARDVVESAKRPAVELLQNRFAEVEKEITGAFKSHANPLDEAADALLRRYDKQLARQDQQSEALLQLILKTESEIPAELARLSPTGQVELTPVIA